MQGRGIDAVFDEVICPIEEDKTQDMETWGDCSALLPWLFVKPLDTHHNNKKTGYLAEYRNLVEGKRGSQASLVLAVDLTVTK